MKAKFIGVLATALLALAAFGPTSASAATEVGNPCTAEDLIETVTVATLANGGPVPAKVPSAGVITSWTLRQEVGPLPPDFKQALKVFRSTGAPTQYQVIGESAPSPISLGANTFGTRIPVLAGDFLGASGTYSGTVYSFICITGNPADRFAYFLGSPTQGSTVNSLIEAEGLQSSVTAKVEPDADNDGFGDETQDSCPQSASTQAPCPLAVLSASAVVRKGLATILITSNVQVPVTVAGKVNIGKGQKVNLNGGTQVVVPGTLAKFTVLFPARLKERLKSLSRKRFLQLALTATAPNIAAGPTVQKVNAKAKGQKKPARKGKRGKAKGKGGKRG